MSVRVDSLDFDTEVFGLRCGRLAFGALPPSREALDAAVADAHRREIVHLVARVPSQRAATCRGLESCGFRFTVCSLSLEKTLKHRESDEPRASARAESPSPGHPTNRRDPSALGCPIPSGSGGLTRTPSAPSSENPSPTPGRDGAPTYGVSRYKGEDDSRLAAITDAAFNAGTRFHLEPAFGAAGVVALHRRWIANLIADEAVRVWVHRAGGTITGYITLAHGDNPGAGHIGLIGVDPAFRRRGIGQALLAAAEHAARPSFDRLTVATESTNVAALRLYTQAGFTIEQSWTVFHAMIPASREVPHAGKECRTADPRA